MYPDPEHEKKRTQLKTEPLKNFVSSQMEDNVDVIHFYVESRGVQSLVFGQLTLEKCNTNFYFENEEIDMETTIKTLLTRNVLHVNVFLCSFVFNKNAFLSNKQRFLSRVLDVFSQSC